MNEVIRPVKHPDWEVICNRNPEPTKPEGDVQGANGIGFVIAFLIEIAVCVAGWVILHGWRLL